MRNLARSALSIGAAAAFLAACGGPQPPIYAPGSTPQSRILTMPANGNGSWMLPEAHSEGLLYVTDQQDNFTYLISVSSGKLVGTLTGFDQPAGDCVDAEGDVFVVDSQNSEIREYKHGARSAFNVLNDHPWLPMGCSVDPTTGDLAVANCCGETSQGSLAIYAKAKGVPRYRQYGGAEFYWFCAYDGHGNLFVDGITYGNYSFILLEIPKGGRRLTRVTLNPSISGSASLSLFWDGKALAIASPALGAIYQYAIDGNHGTRIHTTTLGGTRPLVGSFWVLSSGKERTLYAPIVRDSIASLGVYRYPAGGKPVQDLYDVGAPFGVTVSVAK